MPNTEYNSDSYAVVWQARDMALTDGGVYTEYILKAGGSYSDLPTDCRAGSLAYDPDSGALYLFDADGNWGEVGA